MHFPAFASFFQVMDRGCVSQIPILACVVGLSDRALAAAINAFGLVLCFLRLMVCVEFVCPEA